MFDFHLGDGLTISSNSVTSPLIVLGNNGQGKTVFLLQYVLECMRNTRRVVLYDPFGDLAKKVQEHVVNPDVRAELQVCTQEEFLQNPNIEKLYTLISGKTLIDGSVYTRNTAQKVLKKVYEQVAEDTDVVVDEAFNIADQELLGHFEGGRVRSVLSGTTLIDLSKKDRGVLLAQTEYFVAYKIRNIDASFLEERIPQIKAKDIAAIQQYHFYWIGMNEARYVRALWPIEKV
jgi:hypothetical protein